jgi:hypothetical protein
MWVSVHIPNVEVLYMEDNRVSSMSTISAPPSEPFRRTGVEELLAQLVTVSDSFDARRKPLRRFDQILFVAQASLILLTTIFTGLKFDGYEVALKNLALAASAVASFLTVIIGRFAFRDRWAAFTDASSQLAALRSRVDLILALATSGQRPIPSADEISTLHKEMQDILDRVDGRWKQIVTTSGSGARPGK